MARPMVQPLFRDRAEAGRVLAEQLEPVIEAQNTIVLALPRGGVSVGFELAQKIHTDLDIFLVRKIGVPGHEELAIGAIASGGVRVLNHAIVEQLGIPPSVIDHVTERELQEIGRRERLYREGRPQPEIAGRTAVLVDDGLATGATMLAAVRGLRAHSPARIIAAVPVASREACDDLREHVDRMVCLATPEPFYAVGIWYEDFSQTTDEEVCNLLDTAAHHYAT